MMAASPRGPLSGVATIEAILRLSKQAPVFPCRPRDEQVVIDGKPVTLKSKSPLTERGFHDASQDEDRIRSWWKRWPDALVGVPTGTATRLVVVDWDPGKHADTTGEWIQNNAEALLSARIHGTNRGGRHYLFRFALGQHYQSGTDLFLAGAKRPGIDLRGEGGYIIWWPLHGGDVTNDQAPLLPAGLIDERLERATRAPESFPQYTPVKWQRDKQLVVDALVYIDPECDRDMWRDMGMAIHLATQGSDDGFNLWHAWSAGELTGAMPSKYEGIDSCRYAWASFKDQSARPVRLGSIFHHAKLGGYVMPKAERDEPQPPADEYFDAPLVDALLEQEVPEITEKVIQATPFVWIDPKTIPPRQWLYGRHYMRGMVGATAGVGGAGKSTLLNVELVSMAIGRDLLNGGAEIPVGPMQVWGHNGEDPYEELQRRIMAVCQHYGVTLEDLGGRLRITSGRDVPIMVARELTDGGKLLVPTQDGKQIAAEILKHKIQVFVADPFVTIHRVNENDNVQIDGVMTILRDLAHSTQSSVEVAHHFRKLNGDEASVDALRGATSLVGACRSVRIASNMSKDDATKYGIDDEQRGFYSWLQNGKANMLPPTHRRFWLFMASANLGNEQPPFNADEVGVVTRWVPPEMSTELTPPEFRLVRIAIQQGNPMMALRADPRSIGWMGKLLAQTLGRDESDKQVKTQMTALISRLEHGGYIKQEEMRDPRQGRRILVYVWQRGAEE
jgi:hypothetical protein